MPPLTRYQQLIQGWLDGTAPPAPITELIGFRFTAFENGEIRAELEAGQRHHNPMGTVHGGVLCDLADAAMGTAFAATLEEGESFATVSLAASYLRAVREGLLSATARVVHRGRNVGHVECEIVDAKGRQVARFASACTVIRP
ncbi:MAG TPA: PaaI family thioesterase [Thermoanaerobaculia bacterium]|nr:PaaI family thioesterase [Thermoanaerobaculia bacterium]